MAEPDDKIAVPESDDSLLAALVQAAKNDPALRAAIGQLGAKLLRIATETQPEDKSAPPVPIVERTLSFGGEETTVHVQDGGLTPVLTSPELELQQSTSQVARSEHRSEINLATVARRCQLKAEGCRWAVERRRRLAGGDEFNQTIAPTDQDLIRRARDLSDCYLWMLDPYGPQAENGELEIIAQCYENVATAVELAHSYITDVDAHEDLAQLYATAQSALRRVILETIDLNDRDQIDAHRWLSDFTNERGMFLQRHMRSDDAADPTDWGQLQQDLDDWRERREQVRGMERHKRQLLHQVEYHIPRILDDSPDSETNHDWTRILDAAAKWVGHGFPPTDKAITKVLSRLENVEVPDDIPIGPDAQLVLDAVDRYIALRQRSTAAVVTSIRERPEHVVAVANLLRGRVVVLIGGDQRPHAKSAIERDLELKELRWIETKHGMPLDRIETAILQPDVALVIMAIRWISHVFGDFAELCSQRDVPFVRLRAGYNPAQVANHILEQAGDRLTRQ